MGSRGQVRFRGQISGFGTEDEVMFAGQVRVLGSGFGTKVEGRGRVSIKKPDLIPSLNPAPTPNPNSDPYLYPLF